MSCEWALDPSLTIFIIIKIDSLNKDEKDRNFCSNIINYPVDRYIDTWINTLKRAIYPVRSIQLSLIFRSMQVALKSEMRKKEFTLNKNIFQFFFCLF